MEVQDCYVRILAYYGTGNINTGTGNYQDQWTNRKADATFGRV